VTRKIYASASYFIAPKGRCEKDYDYPGASPGVSIKYGLYNEMLIYGEFTALGGEELELDSLERDFFVAKPGDRFRIRRRGNPYDKAIWEVTRD